MKIVTGVAAIQKWANEGRLGNVIITMETEDKRYQGKEAIKAHIREKDTRRFFCYGVSGKRYSQPCLDRCRGRIS
jgi:hypothetical protein